VDNAATCCGLVGQSIVIDKVDVTTQDPE